MTRIAVINGNNVVGHARQDSRGRVCHEPDPSFEVEDRRKLFFIKLSREIVDSGKRRGANRNRTNAFSHTGEDLEGRRAVIWCDGDHGGFHSAFIGTIFGAGTTTDGVGRNYTLKDCTPISRAEWNTTYARLAHHSFEV